MATPFQEGNASVGRLLLFLESLHNAIGSFILTEDLKLRCCRGLQTRKTEPCCLRTTCGLAQDRFMQVLKYFDIKHR